MIINNENRFCYWDCQSLSDTLVVFFNMIITLLLLIFIFHVYLLSRTRLKKGVIKFYIMLIGWAIIFFLKDIFGVVVYFTLYRGNVSKEENDPDFQEQITKISSVYEVFETIPALLLQSLLFLIPFKMVGNVMGIMQILGHKVSEKQILLYKILSIYRYCRPIVILPLILVLVFGFINEAGMAENMTITKTTLLIFDSIVCSFLLYFSYRYVTTKYKKIKLQNQYEMTVLRRQTIAMVIASLCRLLLNLVFYLIIPEVSDNYLNKYTCLRRDYERDGLFTFGYLLFGTILIHFLPVWVIANMYKVQ